MNTLADFVRKLRPAPLAGLVARICGLDRRRLVRTEQGTFFLNPMSVLAATLRQREYEPQTRAVLYRYLKPGGVFIDMGANEGYFTVIGSRLVGRQGTVVAVEPQARLESVILDNLVANDCYNVRLFRCAVSDKTQKVRFSMAAYTNSGSSSLFRQTRYARPTEEVQSFCLGDFLDRAGVDRCDLLKVDIESSEYEVFMTAGDVLRRGALKHIVLEIHDSLLAKRGLSADALHQQMISCGYELNTELGPRVYSLCGHKNSGIS